MSQLRLSTLVLVGCIGTNTGKAPMDDPSGPDPRTDPTPSQPDPSTFSNPGTPALSNLFWQNNPHYLGPFTVSWNQVEQGVVHVEYRVDDTWFRTPDIEGLPGPNRTTVLGVPLGTTAAWRIVTADDAVFDADSDLVAIGVPSGLPSPSVQIDDTSLWSASGNYVLLPINGNGSAFYIIMDRAGRPIWATNGSNILYSELSASGDGLLWGDTSRDEAYRAYLDEPIETVDIPGHYHALAGMPDGTIVWDGGGALRELGPTAASSASVWSGPGISYLNGITYNPLTDQLGLSSFAAQSIAIVNRGTYDVQFSAPGIGGTPIYDFQPEESELNNQHGIEFLANGNLLASTVDNATQTVWLREYVIDDAVGAMREVWNYDSGFNDVSWSWAHRLDSGNTLHTLGPQGRLYEVTPDGEVAWRVRYNNRLGRAQVIDDLYELVAP